LCTAAGSCRPRSHHRWRGIARRDNGASAWFIPRPDRKGDGKRGAIGRGDGCDEREQQSLLHVARTDDPRGDAVDRGVEIVEADAHATDVPAPDDLLRDGLQFVGERDDVVAVPAHAAADVECNLRQIEEHGGDLVGDALGGMVVAGVERDEDLAADGIAQVELVRADHVGFRADAEQFAFDGVEIQLRIDLRGKHFVQRLLAGLRVA